MCGSTIWSHAYQCLDSRVGYSFDTFSASLPPPLLLLLLLLLLLEYPPKPPAKFGSAARAAVGVALDGRYVYVAATKATATAAVAAPASMTCRGCLLWRSDSISLTAQTRSPTPLRKIDPLKMGSRYKNLKKLLSRWGYIKIES